MKWKNKGHEFDELGNIFIKNKDIILIGDECETEYLKKKLDFLGVNINTINNFPEYKEEKGLKKLIKKIKLKYIIKNNLNGKTVIVASSIACNDFYINWIENELKLKRNINMFSGYDFLEKYLSIFAVYVSEKVYIPSNCLISTTICNLNCESCLNFAPYDKNQQHRDIEVLKKDVDMYFSCIDRVGLFHISGGEPLLYPHLVELIKYISNNYKDKIDILGTVTNGTIVPSDELCKVFKEYNVQVECDDYRQNVPRLNKTYAQLVEQLEKHNVNSKINLAGECWEWLELFPPRNNMENADEEVLCEKYNKCGNPFIELKDGKIYSCNFASYAATAGLKISLENDFLDISKFNSNQKKELVEFRLGYTTKGYVDFCKYCNGLQNINPIQVTPAKQAEGKLEWNMNKESTVKC